MRSVVKWLLALAIAAMLAVVLAPAAQATLGDDWAGFYVHQSLQVGSVVLEPGIYMVRAVHSAEGHAVLTICNADNTKVFATLIATPHEIAADDMSPIARILYEVGDANQPNRLRTFLASNTRYGYDVFCAKPATLVASRREVTLYAMK